MKQDSVSPTPTGRELLAGLALFVLPMLPSLLQFASRHQSANSGLGGAVSIVSLIMILVVLAIGLKHGVPRWAVPYLGVAITTLIMLGPAWRIWDLFYSDIQAVIDYSSRTLQVRVLYQTLMSSFNWLLVCAFIALLILFLNAWSSTNPLAGRVRLDGTLLSYMLFGGVVIRLELIFEGYVFDELWRIACLVCLALGAWGYLMSASKCRRCIALLSGVTLTYLLAAVGKWYLVPLQVWGAFHGLQYETYGRFEFWRTLTEWAWVMFIMVVPALLNRATRPATASVPPNESPGVI
ncbi:MAG: hypothetical protein GX620_05265 [Chloroflexi bacterium]|nr:hypothetical protein [Chloroflexota bacterium]